PAPWRTTGENELTFKFSAKAGGFHADGTSWTRKPIKLFDASGREFTPDETFMLGNDSVIKVHFRPGGYTAANKVGLKLDLCGAQVGQYVESPRFKVDKFDGGWIAPPPKSTLPSMPPSSYDTAQPSYDEYEPR